MIAIIAHVFAANNAAPADAAPLTDIHDIKPILSLGMDRDWVLWALAALALAALALAVWWWRKRRRRTVTPPAAAPAPAPEIEAWGRLDALGALGDIDGRRFYFELSAILRRYLERRFAIPAAEMTLEELLPQVERLPLTQDLAADFKNLSRAAEPVKFAGRAADPQKMPADLTFARDFVQRTTPLGSPADAEAAAHPSGIAPAEGPPLHANAFSRDKVE